MAHSNKQANAKKKRANKDTKWHLDLFVDRDDWLDVLLHCDNPAVCLCKISLDISLGEFSSNHTAAVLCSSKASRGLLNKEISVYSLEDAHETHTLLRIKCCLDAFPDLGNSGTAQSSFPPVVPHYEKLLAAAVLSDMHFEIGTERIAAHRAILAVRSPVFQKMFESGMTESTDNVVKINDFGVDVFREMLTFLYTGQINMDFLSENLAVFVALADKYDIGDLKTVCCKLLQQDRTPSNVSSMLLLAHTYSIDEAKQDMMQYICSHFNEVIVTNDYAKLVKENVALVGEINLEHAQYLRQQTANKKAKTKPATKAR